MSCGYNKGMIQFLRCPRPATAPTTENGSSSVPDVQQQQFLEVAGEIVRTRVHAFSKIIAPRKSKERKTNSRTKERRKMLLSTSHLYQ